MNFDNFLTKELPLIPGWCCYEKAKKLIEVIIETKPDICLEIGVFGGSSLIPQALALKHNGKGVVAGIDPWCNHSATEEMQNETNKKWWGELDLEQIYKSFLGNLKKYEVEEFTKVLRNKSSDFVSDFKDESIGLLHIDGNHCEKLAYSDAVMYLPKVKSEGYIFFDDIAWSEDGVNISTKKGLNYLLTHGCEQVCIVGKDCMVLRKTC